MSPFVHGFHISPRDYIVSHPNLIIPKHAGVLNVLDGAKQTVASKEST